MLLYDMARKVNAQLKRYKKAQAGRVLSPVRRIESVAPLQSGRFCAMTFDDGPCALPPDPWEGDQGLTDILLDILKTYGAKATFDVIGTTAHNYPDIEGKRDNFSWSGIGYDHYPRFGEDHLAGAVNQPALIRRILDDGHEIANHGYAHRLFGPMKAVYGGRKSFSTLEEVTSDLNLLHQYMKVNFNYEIKLSRPPHYIDSIPQGGTAYDAYRILGYNYMAASFDGGGWLPSGGCYNDDVEKMVAPLRSALSANPNSLNGKIIFQKDGCNMSFQTPIVHALPKQLELLKNAGYQVVPVSSLLALSPFEDVAEDSFESPYVQTLLAAGHITGYQNNTFHGERAITSEEFCLMVCPPQIFAAPKPLSYQETVILAKDYCTKEKIPISVSGDTLLKLAQERKISINAAYFCNKTVLRKYAVSLLAELIK